MTATFPHGRQYVPPPVRRPAGMAWFVVALAAVSVVCGLFGCVAGGVTGLVITEPPGNEAPPPFAAEFPGGEQRYMTGVTTAVVVDDWMKRKNSWVCTDQSDLDSYSLAKKALDCRPPDDQGDAHVLIEYDADDQVKLVSSNCTAGLKSELCTTLAITLVGAVLSPQGAQLRKEAEEWAKENSASERVTTIGGIRLEASLDPYGLTATPGF